MSDKNQIKVAAAAARWGKAADRPLPLDAVIDPEFLPQVVRFTWHKNSKGYYYTRIARKNTSLHRFVWSLKFGGLPKELDHINKNRADCRIQNLRPATRKMNTSGTGRHSSRKRPDLPRGVSKHFTAERYQARLGSKYLGLFRTPEEASAAYESALESLIAGESANAI
jgi:hypothetical protein